MSAPEQSSTPALDRALAEWEAVIVARRASIEAGARRPVLTVEQVLTRLHESGVDVGVNGGVLPGRRP